MKIRTKQTARTGTESEKWISRGGISVGRGKGGMGENVQGRRSMVSRHKVDGERQKMVWETEDSKNLYVQPMDMN